MNKRSFPFRVGTAIKRQGFLSLVLLLVLCSAQTYGKGPGNDPVKIGLLIQDKACVPARQGAELAVAMANKKGGFRGRPFQLVVKDMEGPWGTGSKQAVDLIWDDKVCALIGSHDGRNAHLVEQAATKSIVVYISAWSADPSLSQAFVPWFFNAVPTDRQQAEALIDEIYDKRKIGKIVTITDKEYDSGQALKNFIQSSELGKKAKPIQLKYEDYAADLNKLMVQINKSGAKGMVVFCSPSVSLKLIRFMKQKKTALPLFGSLSVLNENVLKETELKECADALMVPHSAQDGTEARLFRDAYFKKYGSMPGLAASYAYDATSVLIEAIKVSGSLEREKIQNALRKLHYSGATGPVQFDDKGNRSGKPKVSRIPAT
jgi:branched-chain amino acid transport system substrate-binding protein